MYKLNWIQQIITTNYQANNMIKLFKEVQPTIGAFDTETNGLHIIKSKPFLYQFGFVDDKTNTGYTYAVDLSKRSELARQVIIEWHKLAKTLKVYLGHNVKFDLHMLINIGLPYEEPNISDTMSWIRFAHDALTTANGGPPLALKEYASRYISAEAKSHEQLIAKERTDLAKVYNSKLKK